MATAVANQAPHQFGKEAEEKKINGGFVVPETNSFGETFRKLGVKKMREEYIKMDKMEMSIWECCELLNDVVDESDLDSDLPQMEHLLQTAESIRKDYPDEDWLHLTGLIHDLGKVLLLPQFGGLPYWAVVGDTYPVGCAFDESILHHKYFKENPDYHNPAYNTKYGVYSENCGLDNVLMSWGHDDYMWRERTKPLYLQLLFFIIKTTPSIVTYELYSKATELIDVEKVKPYYLSLMKRVYKDLSVHA
ncbi:hypothetical protein G4B88_022301 [Cannabis sativa]|uniref:Inositol oxygenase n=1 Tax=Cannabis sativa TaxID=3483 RepID=A0A7J6HWZ0_CANSA|nr:hypothetical protein G4B88_022301 [Cannabis sativa]